MSEVVNGEGAGETAGTPPVTPPARPEHIPEKFWDADKGEIRVEDLARSYSELEKRGAKPEGEPKGTEGQPAGEPPVDPNDPKPTPYAAAMARAEAELAEGVPLSEDTYKAFEAQGIERNQLDIYIAGQNAIFELRKIKVESTVGGGEAYAAMLEWAAANYNQTDAEAFNATVFGADEAAAFQAAAALKTRYEEAMGNDGKIVTDGTGNTGGNGYKNKAEWMADIRKPEYKKDPAFQDQVRKKLEGALKAGVNMGVAINVG